MGTNTALSDEEQAAIEALTYEQAFAELQSIVTDLESDDHSLDEALTLFERGQALAHHCADLLDQADLKIKQLSGGELVDFEVEA
jgi:exodeoxyribonuclease VII small subunit